LKWRLLKGSVTKPPLQKSPYLSDQYKGKNNMNKQKLVLLVVPSFSLLCIGLMIAVVFAGVGSRLGSGSGMIVSKERPVADFDSIFVRGEGMVFLTQGEAVSVVVKTDDNLISKVYTEVGGGTLELSYAGGLFGTHLKPTQGYNYHITVVDLEDVTIKGSAEVFADDVVAEQLELEVIGSGQIDMDNLSADEVWVDITGSGEITLSGQAETQKISLLGSGIFDGHDFEGKYVEVSNRGSGTVTVWATDDLDTSIAGEGVINYYGDVVPDVSNGSGEVVSLGNR
jgi:hypothetical protein